MTGCNDRCCVAFPMNDLKHADIVAWRDKHPDYLEYYAGRPLLCSTYPYGDVCRHCWLTLDQMNNRLLAPASEA